MKIVGIIFSLDLLASQIIPFVPGDIIFLKSLNVSIYSIYSKLYPSQSNMGSSPFDLWNIMNIMKQMSLISRCRHYMYTIFRPAL